MMISRTDANQAAIVDVLRAVGATVHSLHAVGHGCPDLLVGFRGANWLLEVKTETGKLRKSQKAWLSDWRGQAAVVRSVDDALEVIGAI